MLSIEKPVRNERCWLECCIPVVGGILRLRIARLPNLLHLHLAHLKLLSSLSRTLVDSKVELSYKLTERKFMKIYLLVDRNSR